MPEIYQIIYISLASAFFILVATKTGFREATRDKCDYAGIDIIAKMLECDLCISFWTSLVICLVFLPRDLSLLIIPIFSTPITRMLI